MNQDYQEHRQALLSVISNALSKYRGDVDAGLSSATELMGNMSSALEANGSVRLFKYQPFSERNLQDCRAGVLHLTQATKLNDVNEGNPLFNKETLVQAICSFDSCRVDLTNLDELPQAFACFAKDGMLSKTMEDVNAAKASGALAAVIAPGMASVLEEWFKSRRPWQLCGSLCTTERSASMWDRYANGHRGFVAGYTLSAFVTDYSRMREGVCRLGHKALLAPVYYGDRPDVSFVAASACACSQMVGCLTNMEYLLHALSLLQKAPEWEYEREWRIIAYSCSDDSRAHYCKLVPDSVYLGIEMREDERNRVIEIAKSEGWRVYEMARSDDSLDWALGARPLKII